MHDLNLDRLRIRRHQLFGDVLSEREDEKAAKRRLETVSDEAARLRKALTAANRDLAIMKRDARLARHAIRHRRSRRVTISFNRLICRRRLQIANSSFLVAFVHVD